MTVFISRSVAEAPVFEQLLQAQGLTVQGKALIAISPLPYRVLPEVDWVFFSSKNAVRCLLEHAPPLSCRVAALGPATAAALSRYVAEVDFMGTGDPVTTTAHFKEVIGTTRPTVLFPGAKNSQQSVQNLLDDAVTGLHWEVYDNQPITDVAPITAAILVFTSPMNARAYFSGNILLPYQRVVAIGNTTAQAIKDIGITEVCIAAEPSEISLAKAVLHLRT